MLQATNACCRFLVAFAALQTVTFIAGRVGITWTLLPTAICCNLLVPDISAWDNEGYVVRSLSKVLRIWWYYALAAHLPRDFPARLPGECCCRAATRPRVRVAWGAVWLVLACGGQRTLRQRAVRFITATALGPALGGVARQLVAMGLRLMQVYGLCALAPTGHTLFTQAGRQTILLLLLNQWCLALCKVPLTMGVIYALARSGPRAAAVVLLGAHLI